VEAFQTVADHMASGVNKMAFLLTKCDCADIYIMMFNTDSTDSTYTVQAETEIPTTGDVRRLHRMSRRRRSRWGRGT